MKKIFWTIVVVLGLAGIAGYGLPWKSMLEQKIEEALHGRGFMDAHVTVAETGFQKTVLKDISAEGAFRFSVKEITLAYSLWDILRGSVRGVDALDIEFAKPESHFKTNIVQAQASFKNARDGDWKLQALQVEMDEKPWGVLLYGSGTLRLDRASMVFTGKLTSTGRAGYLADFSFDSRTGGKISLATIPWNGGKLSMQDVDVVPGKPVKLNLSVESVSVDALLQAVTGERVSATGAVSGNIPLTVEWDGSFLIGEGRLLADRAGTITMPPDAIPGDNEQVAMTREILKNFHYSSLSITVSNGKGKEISLFSVLEGNNPDMYNGHPVKINVRLGGDILDLIRQNVMFLTDPESMLNQGRK